VFISLRQYFVVKGNTCDIVDGSTLPNSNNLRCVAAHSTVRALYANYTGPLYQVRRTSDNAVRDIPVIDGVGFADASIQNVFCNQTDCVISLIYDQSSEANHLSIAPAGGAHRQPDVPTNATVDPLLVGGYNVFSAYFEGGMGYRNDKTTGVAVGDEPQTIYMVTSGLHFNERCCFDYGNAETNNLDDGKGTMEALYFGNAKGGLNHGGAGPGPWIMADLENGLWGADVVQSNEPTIQHDFVTAILKGDSNTPGPWGPIMRNIDHGNSDMEPCGFDGCVLAVNATHEECANICNTTLGCVGVVFADANCSGKRGPLCWTKSFMSGSGTSHQCRDSQARQEMDGHWALKGGNAQTGALKIFWDGKRPEGYATMQKQGAIILGIGGDNSDGAVGTFYEGAMIAGYTSDDVDDAIQANIVETGYGK
jgi:hypothetical protein